MKNKIPILIMYILLIICFIVTLKLDLIYAKMPHIFIMISTLIITAYLLYKEFTFKRDYDNIQIHVVKDYNIKILKIHTTKENIIHIVDKEDLLQWLECKAFYLGVGKHVEYFVSDYLLIDIKVEFLVE